MQTLTRTHMVVMKDYDTNGWIRDLDETNISIVNVFSKR